MDCPRPIKSCVCRVYATWSSRTRPSMRIQRSEGLGSRLGCSTRKTSVNFDPSNLENFQVPSVDPIPRSDMNLSQSHYNQSASTVSYFAKSVGCMGLSFMVLCKIDKYLTR